MEIKKVTDPEFRKYGKVVENIDFSGLIRVLQEKTPLPADVVYEPSAEVLEAEPVFETVQEKAYGEMPVQIGYCNGHNHKLNALEYHRSSEINVAATDAILLVGHQQDITPEFTYDTALVEVYATTLHYAPCSVGDQGFQVGIILPRGTNYPLKAEHKGWEDSLLAAANKWLIGHPKGGLPEGSHLGLIGENITV